MKGFTYYAPTTIIFGAGKLAELGEVVSRYGKRVILVSGSSLPKAQSAAIQVALEDMQNKGLEVVVFDGVVPNPTLDVVRKGADVARAHKAQVVLGFGGGSAMDAAKAIAVSAIHEGTAWDYLFSSDKQPTEKTLPIVAVSTTSGTGSHVTHASVITKTDIKSKSSLCHPNLFPRTCIVDPNLMRTMPKSLTASSGFDAFSHAFESYINIRSSIYTDMMALKSIKLIIENLRKAVEDGEDMEARVNMAWADTLAGLSIANAGVTLPHAMGEPVSGHYPSVSHGRSLAAVYPAFIWYTCQSAVNKFANVARLFDSGLALVPDSDAAAALKGLLTEFLEQIGLRCTLDDLGVEKDRIEDILRHCMGFPNIIDNPAVPDEPTVRALYMKCFK